MASPVTITSLDDPRVELYRNVRDRDLYGRDRLFMAESEMVVQRLLQSSVRVHSVLLTPLRYEAMREVLDELNDSAPVYVAELDVMCDIAGFHVHRGALALGYRPGDVDLQVDRVLGDLRNTAACRLLLAEGLTNVDNIGGLFRVAAGLGVDAIVLDSSCCDPLYRKAIRVSMGHVFSVPYAISRHWHDDLRALRKEYGITIVGAETCAGARSIRELECPARSAVLVGSEAHGLQPATLELCDVIACIPMRSDVPSINVVSAAAIFMYGLQRPDV